MRRRLAVLALAAVACFAVAAPADAGINEARTAAWHAARYDCGFVFPNTCQGPYADCQLCAVLAPSASRPYYTFYYHYYGYYGSRRVICRVTVNSYSSGTYAWVAQRSCAYA